MRIKDPKYKEWKIYQNYKNLIKRTKKKKRSKKNCKKKRIIYQQITAPNMLSIINNSEETIKYFNKAIRILKNPESRNKFDTLLFDCKKVEYLSIDALMYLFAIVRNYKNVFSGIREIKGNWPENEYVRKAFLDSEFLNYVNNPISSEIEQQKEKTLKIATGNNVKANVASEFIDFVVDYFNCSNIETKFLYKMIIELMTNTHNHAYNNKNDFIKAWYILAAVNSNKNCIEFTFADTGEGIPVTVAKKAIEKIFTKDDNQYIISALNGDFRTQTHERNRGKGLPDIYEHFNEKQIKNLKIISCKGKVELNDDNKPFENNGIELENNMHGTVFYWEINLRKESDLNDN